MPLDYEEKFLEAYRVNAENVIEALDKGELDTKINNFCKLNKFDSEDIKAQIRSNPVVAAFFVKNPNKQNLYEKVAAEEIAAIQNVKDFKNLPSNGLILLSGAVVPSGSGGHSTAKTIDFEWTYFGIKFYAYHKYTKDSGGSQESAYKDLQAFIDEAGKTTLQDTVFVAIADGDFYQTKDAKAKKTKIKRLKELAGSDKVFACTIDELEAVMEKITKKAKR